MYGPRVQKKSSARSVHNEMKGFFDTANEGGRTGKNYIYVCALVCREGKTVDFVQIELHRFSAKCNNNNNNIYNIITIRRM